jgi:hypothetical protein
MGMLRSNKTHKHSDSHYSLETRCISVITVNNCVTLCQNEHLFRQKCVRCNYDYVAQLPNSHTKLSDVLVSFIVRLSWFISTIL